MTGSNDIVVGSWSYCFCESKIPLSGGNFSLVLFPGSVIKKAEVGTTSTDDLPPYFPLVVSKDLK